MYKIDEVEELSAGVKSFWVDAPLVARKCQAGQFVILRIDEAGERIPLTIADYRREQGKIRLIFQEVGATTRQLGTMKNGEALLDLAGPLGKATEVEHYGTVVCIGGGIGVAPIYPIARAYKQAGNHVISILGARNADLLILEKEMREVSDELIITTDDGSIGQKGLVIDPLKKMIADGRSIDRVMAIGPMIMMKSVAEVTRPHKIHTLVSLNPIMVDGTGMCGGCRCSVDGQTKFACVDGPEFDGHAVDFNGLMSRSRMYQLEDKQCRGDGSCHK